MRAVLRPLSERLQHRRRPLQLLRHDGDAQGGAGEETVARRLEQLVGHLAEEGYGPPGQPGPDTVAAALTDGGDRVAWFVLAVLDAELPRVEDVVAVRRRVRLRGGETVLRDLLSDARRRLDGTQGRRVLLLRGAVAVDLQHTSETELATGIQRVARQTAARWSRDHHCHLVGWTPEGRSLRLLTGPDRDRALTGTSPADASTSAPQDEPATVVVPWDGTYLLPELVTESDRLARLAALARFSGVRTAVIGFDCVPVTSAETTAEAMGGAFAQNLAAVRDFDRVGAISHAAATEYSGWGRMCRAAGWPSPEVRAIPLPTEAAPPVPGAYERFVARTAAVASVPYVLVVGSHEPRKNHLALLHAAERLWREDLTFGLLFVGGNSWHGERFLAEMDRAVARGRRVDSIRALPDDELWAAYRSARCVAFPSLNEGFGLPVAEALSVGTPVLTSGFGSMAEIAVGGGALLVDPRDDDSVVEGLRTLLSDDAMTARLRSLAAGRSVRTWDEYAAELWGYLVESDGTATG